MNWSEDDSFTDLHLWRKRLPKCVQNYSSILRNNNNNCFVLIRFIACVTFVLGLLMNGIIFTRVVPNCIASQWTCIFQISKYEKYITKSFRSQFSWEKIFFIHFKSKSCLVICRYRKWAKTLVSDKNSQRYAPKTAGGTFNSVP